MLYTTPKPRKVRNTRNGFEYNSENILGHWHWEFRPVGATVDVPFTGKKAQFMAMLDTPAVALKYYQDRLQWYTDIPRLRAQLERAERAVQQSAAPDWDPGGRTNNPGKVERALKAAADAPRRLREAQAELEAAEKLRAKLEANPFDYAAWQQQWLR